MSFELKKGNFAISGNLLMIILDGVGIYKGKEDGYPGNALELANAPAIKSLMKNGLIYTELKAHGTFVGLPSDEDMGNSEVGHNAFGAGRIFDQGTKLVSQAIASGKIFQDKDWKDFMVLAKDREKNSSLHFIGLLSDGNVHSHIDHLLAMLEECGREGLGKVFVHTLLDGRDVEEVSAHKYISMLEEKMKDIDPTGEGYAIASGGGRMKVTMDRYEADWSMVELGWKTHVKGEGKYFSSAREALEKLRKENPGVIDQDLPAFVIARDGKAVGPIEEDDIVIFYNFRGDRAIEISRAFTEKNFDKFKRVPDVKVHYAGMMEYDGDLKIPPRFLVTPPQIRRTISEYLVHNGIRQYAISETQKFGHVTYFWNGNNSKKFDEELEDWQEIPSDVIPFEQKPRMKADEITDSLLGALDSGKYQFLRVNFANGDMVGHTGVLASSVNAVEAVDQNVSRLLEKARATNTTVIITADHGNCDQMFEVDKSGNIKKNKDGSPMAKTSHTLNPVPFIVTGSDSDKWQLNRDIPKWEKKPGIGNMASTILTLMGFVPPEDYLPSLIEPKD